MPLGPIDINGICLIDCLPIMLHFPSAENRLTCCLRSRFVIPIFRSPAKHNSDRRGSPTKDRCLPLLQLLLLAGRTPCLYYQHYPRKCQAKNPKISRVFTSLCAARTCAQKIFGSVVGLYGSSHRKRLLGISIRDSAVFIERGDEYIAVCIAHINNTTTILMQCNDGGRDARCLIRFQHSRRVQRAGVEMARCN